MNQPLLSVKEVSSFLHVHPKTVYKLVSENEIPHLKRSGLGLRFRKEEVEEWLERASRAMPSTISTPPPRKQLDISAEEYDSVNLKGDSAVAAKRQRWNYGRKGVYRRKLKSGHSWCYWYYEAKGKVRKVTVPHATCREDAIVAMERRVKEVFNREFGIQKETITFEDFAPLYLEKYAKPRKRNWKTDQKFLRSQLVPFFGAMELRDIGPKHVSEFIVKRQKEGVKNCTIDKHLQVLRKMVNVAEEFGYEVGKNPGRPFHFASGAENRRTRVLSREEEERLMGEAAPHLKPIIQTALLTGMRLQEILNLKVEDVDLSEDTITIRPEVNKTGKLDRIPLPCSLKEILQKLIQENGGKTEFMFNYLDPRTDELRPIRSVQHAFQAACRRAGIKGLQFRDLRRTFSTRLHQKGVDPLVIQRLLRHSSFKISEEVYIQSNLRMMKEAVNRAAGAVKPVKMEHLWNTKEPEDEKTPVTPYFSMN